MDQLIQSIKFLTKFDYDSSYLNSIIIKSIPIFNHSEKEE